MKKVFENIKEFILKHKKLSFLLIVLVIIGIIIVVFLLNSGNKEPVETLEDRVRSRARTTALTYVMLWYDVGNPNVRVTTVKETENNEYEVYGKISVKDNYGDPYGGTFDGICSVDEIEDISCDLDYSDFYRDN